MREMSKVPFALYFKPEALPLRVCFFGHSGFSTFVPVRDSKPERAGAVIIVYRNVYTRLSLCYNIYYALDTEREA